MCQGLCVSGNFLKIGTSTSTYHIQVRIDMRKMTAGQEISVTGVIQLYVVKRFQSLV